MPACSAAPLRSYTTESVPIEPTRAVRSLANIRSAEAPIQ
jgi:hypothetical protein